MMKKLFFSLLFLISFVANAQYTSIPDPEFEWFLIYSGYDSGNIDGKVLTSNINTIKEIYFFPGAANINIKDLTGIEDFKALEKLNCMNCNLTSLDLSKNIFLTELICVDNKLTSLNVSGCINLKTINCNGNQFTSLDFTQTNNLETLYCRGTKLIDLKLNTNLINLDCSYNKLITLDLSKSILLETLVCEDCNLNSLDISNNIYLTSLSCLNNQLTYLNVSKNIKLIQLSCENNLLNNIDITNNPELVSLQCPSNQLTNLNISQNIKLTNLDCSVNQITNLDTSNNAYLSELWCFNNQITSLNISKNINLIKLLCYDNKLISLNTSQNLKLEILYCHNNLITSLDVSMNNNLDFFRCANNKLTYLDLRNSKSWTWWNDTSYWTNNPKLDCIYVPDAIFFNIYYSNRKDNTANYFDESPPKFESTTQTVCSKLNPTLNDIVVTGYNIKWFDSLLGGNELPDITLLADGSTYFAMNTAGSCESLRTPITITLQPISVPSGISPQNLCNLESPTLNNINVSGTSIKWYDIATNGNLLPNSTPINNGSTYFASQTQNGCESLRIPILANLLNIIKPTIYSPQPFCIQQNATLNDIAITTGQNVKWYDALTAGTLLSNTTPLQNGITYYASQTINGCESGRVAIEIKIQDTPAPTGNANQTFCSDQNSTIANITVTGQDIKWYDVITNGNVLLSNASLQNGITYYASQTLNSCEGERLAVTVSIQNTPGVPTGDTNPKFCKSEKATFNNINITGENLKWYDSNTAANPLENTTLLENNTTYYVSQSIGCESDRLAVLVNVYDTPLPIANASKTFCIEENATIDNIIITGQNIKWYDTSSAGNVLTVTTALESKTYYATQTNNNCESNRLGIAIKIQNNQVPIADANQNFCIQQNAIINTIKLNGQNIKWYNAETDGINLSESTPLENGITYYASQTIYNCESERTPITIQIQEATTVDCIHFIDELPFPKFFTPNNDGYNDTWTIDFIYLAPKSSIRIFDRYGKPLKELGSNSNDWDGTFIGQTLPATDYWFVATQKNGKEYKGHFSLKR